MPFGWRPGRRAVLLRTITVFGTPVDVTLSELALECFYPADPGTAAILQRAAKNRQASQ